MVELNSSFSVLFTSLSAKLALFHSIEKQVCLVSPKIRLIGADSDSSCVGASKINSFQVLPLLKSLSREDLLQFCRKYNIHFIIPSRDGELGYFAKHRDFLFKNNIGVMVSEPSTIELCEDKLEFSNYLKTNCIAPITTSSKLDNFTSDSKRFVVKDRRGNASSSLGLNLSKDDASLHARKIENPIFQPFIKGKEFSADAWMDQNGNCKSLVLRWRVKIVKGESHESVTFSNPEWEQKVKKTLNGIQGLRGHVMAQVIVDNSDNLHLVEINPRLGGATPLSLEAGLSSIYWTLSEFINPNAKIKEISKIKHGMKLLKKDGQVSIT